MFKKSIFFALAASLIFATGVYAAPAIKLIVDGKTIKTDVKLINSTSYVPLRAVSEALGAELKWDGATSTITINSANTIAPSDQSGVYNAGEFQFFNVTAENGQFGWEVVSEIKNVGIKDYKGITFTATFYDKDKKRVGIARGSAMDLKKGQSKTASLITTDDLTGYATIKFQIDVSY